MNIEYGHGYGGIAAAIHNLKDGSIVTAGPDTSLEPLGGTRYYRSLTGLTGAWRLPDRPYLRRLRTYYHRSEPPCTPIGEVPWVPVDRNYVACAMPIVLGVTEALGVTEYVKVYMCDESYLEQIPSTRDRWEIPDQDWVPIEIGSMSFHETIDGPVRAQGVTIMLPPGSEARTSYEQRRVAWRMARKLWAGRTQLPNPDNEIGVVVGLGEEGLLYGIVDHSGLITHVFPSGDALVSWLRTEPDHRGIGVLEAENSNAVTIVDRHHGLWRVVADGTVSRLLGTPDWRTGEITYDSTLSAEDLLARAYDGPVIAGYNASAADDLKEKCEEYYTYVSPHSPEHDAHVFKRPGKRIELLE